MGSKRKIGSLIMFTVLCTYLLLPLFYMFVLSQHKYNVFQSLGKQEAKSIVFSFSENQFKNLNFCKNEDEIVIDKKHFEVVNVLKTKTGFQISVVPDEFEDNFVCNNKVTQENWLSNSCCWPFFEQITTLEHTVFTHSTAYYRSEIEKKIKVPFFVRELPPPKLYS